MNDELIKIIYDSKNNFIKPYNCIFCNKKIAIQIRKIQLIKVYLLIEQKKRFIGCDGFQLNVNKSSMK